MKRSRMRELSVEVTVGVLIFTILLALCIFTIILSRENIFKTYYPLRVHFRSVSGLTEGDNVLFHGVRVGVVRSMELVPDGVIVNARVEYPIDLHEDYNISIQASSVLGGAYLNVQEGSAGLPGVSRDDLLRGAPPVSLIDDASETFHLVKTALREGGILTNLEQSMENMRAATDDIKTIAHQLAHGQGTLGRLLMDEHLYVTLVSVSDNLDVITSDLVAGKGTLGKLLADDNLHNEVEALASDLRKLSASLVAGEGTAGKLLADETLYNELVTLSGNLNVVARRLVDGEGTLGKLSADDTLYNEFKILVQEGITTLDDIREATPITSFATIFFGAF